MPALAVCPGMLLTQHQYYRYVQAVPAAHSSSYCHIYVMMAMHQQLLLNLLMIPKTDHATLALQGAQNNKLEMNGEH